MNSTVLSDQTNEPLCDSSTCKLNCNLKININRRKAYLNQYKNLKSDVHNEFIKFHVKPIEGPSQNIKREFRFDDKIICRHFFLKTLEIKSFTTIERALKSNENKTKNRPHYKSHTD